MFEHNIAEKMHRSNVKAGRFQARLRLSDALAEYKADGWANLMAVKGEDVKYALGELRELRQEVKRLKGEGDGA